MPISMLETEDPSNIISYPGRPGRVRRTRAVAEFMKE